MNLRQTILGTLLLTATGLLAQPTDLRLCVVQPRHGYSSGESLGEGMGGNEAKLLAKEFATRKLADGTPIQAVAIVRSNRKDSEAEAQQQDCPFIIELWDLNIGDMADHNAAPIADAGMPNGVPFHGNPIDNGIEWAMTRSDSRKVIARGYAPPGQGYRTHVVSNPPIPAIASQVMDKLSRIKRH